MSIPSRILGIKRVEPSIQPFVQRVGLAYLMSGVIEATSLGKMTTDWRMTAVNMPEQRRDLRRFLERVANQKPRPAHHLTRGVERARVYVTLGGVIAAAQGAVEFASFGKLATDWSMQWMCYGEEIIDRVAEGLRS